MVRKKSKLKKIDYIFIVLVLVFLAVWFFSRPLDVKKVDVKFEVAERLGVVSDKESLNFGRVLAGGSSAKGVDIGNNFDFPIKAEVFIDKNLENFVFAKSDFVIRQGQIMKVPINLILPYDIEKGNYSGKIKFVFREFKE